MRLMRLPTKTLRPAMSLVLIMGAGVRVVRRQQCLTRCLGRVGCGAAGVGVADGVR